MKSPYELYLQQIRHSGARDIAWCFDYPEWLEMWLVSGKWEQRGRKSGQYCMCRAGDTGPYSRKNCFIGLTDTNGQERWEKARKILKEDWMNIYKEWRHDNLTQYEIADNRGVHQSTVSKIIKKVEKELYD